MIEVKSSNLSHVNYNQDTQVLTVRFKKGGEYSYHDVPKDVYVMMMNAESIGSFFAKHVKPQYKFTKVESEVKV